MPVVRRFRALGQIRKVESVSSEAEPHEVQQVKRDPKIVHRFESQSGSRKIRKDGVHRFLLRVKYELWDRIEQLSLDCGGQSKGASLNEICCKLMAEALNDELIVKQILKEFPGSSRYILVRSWRDDG